MVDCNIFCKILCPIILAIAFLFNTVGNWAGIGDIIPTDKCLFGCDCRETTTEETSEDIYTEITTDPTTNDILTEIPTEIPGSTYPTVPDPSTEPSTEEPSSEVPSSDPVTDPVTEPSSHPVTEPTTEETTTEITTETTTEETTTEPTTEEPTTEPVTEPVTEPTTEPTTAEPTTEPTTRVPTTVTTTESGPRIKSATEKNFASLEGTGNDVFTGADSAPDGGYVAVGTSSSQDGAFANIANGAWSDYYSFIIKYNSDSSVAWMKSLGSPYGGVRFEDVAVLNDGSIVAVGYTSAFDYAVDEETEYTIEAIIVKYSAKGDLLWEKSFGGKRSDIFYCVSKTGNGFVVGGKSDSIDFSFDEIGTKTVARAIIMNFDFDGNILWNRYLEGEIGSSIDAIDADDNNNVFVTCVTAAKEGSFATFEGMGRGYVDTVVIKYNYAGDYQWSFVIGGINREVFQSVAADGNGGCVVGGYYELMNSIEPDGVLSDLHYCGGIDAVAISINADGTKKWSRTVSGFNDDFINDVVKTGDGGFAFVGNTTSGNREFATVGNSGENDSFVCFITRGGTIVSVNSQAGSRNEMARCAAYTAQGGVMVFGQTVSSDGKFAGMNSHLNDTFIELFGNYYSAYITQYKITIKNY